ncbi:reverse transcriptase [Plakobranchus ocellatus]|uniref:Reverse transcriptase n=1 Tax=Plakobranchus ocellatus TaxID=259542 RepID=A0AAV4C3T5_9GAST|nr:reverse transcriptase [Plakobranchus ocellatus]
MLEESDDPVVKTVQPSLKTGRKWKATDAVDEAKECLKMKEGRYISTSGSSPFAGMLYLSYSCDSGQDRGVSQSPQ